MDLNRRWLWIGGGLILYSIVAGLIIPLNPGIVDSSPSVGKEGEALDISFEGYNLSYDRIADTSTIQAWLLVDSTVQIAALEVGIRGDRTGTAHFEIPHFTGEEKRMSSATLVLSDPINGYAILPSAVSIHSDPTVDQNYQLGQMDLAVDDKAGIGFPFRNILQETIRNTYYHVPLWFAMVVLFALSAYNSMRYLRKRSKIYDHLAMGFSEVALVLGVLGLVTGAIWARFTWGAFWSWDIKQFTSAVALLIYSAYFILRSSVNDEDKKGRLSAAYNIFAFILLIPLLFIVPRMTDSLHPGSGGNPAMGGEDLDHTMRFVFYPAVVGWILMGYYLGKVRAKIAWIQNKFEDYF